VLPWQSDQDISTHGYTGTSENSGNESVGDKGKMLNKPFRHRQEPGPLTEAEILEQYQEEARKWE